MTEAEFIKHLPCEACGSSDANALYDDGHTHCFSCGAHVSRSGKPTDSRKGDIVTGLITNGEIRGIRARRLTDETCRKFGYQQAKLGGQSVQVANYYSPEGSLVAQKVRFRDKEFRWLGEMRQNDVLPFGATAFPRTGKKVVVTEGEIDAMAMSQVQGNKWPVVSIPTGAGPQVKKYIALHREYFEGFDEVILMFDQDEPGRDAARRAAEVLGRRVKIATLPLKDACEMLVAGRAEELVTAMWRAEPYRPESLIDLVDLKEQVMTPPEWGLSWPFDTLTSATYGIRLGELYALGAGTGVGKTDFFTQVMSHMVTEHSEKIGVFSLEQEPKETATRLLGKLAHRPFHIPGESDPEALSEAWDQYIQGGRVFFYDSFGVNEWEAVRSKIEYLRDAEGVQYFFLDHLTALAAAEENERVGLERIMADLGSLVKTIPITIFFISHLATPEGKPHEEGGRVTIRHFKGSRAIGFWCHFMFGLERNTQAEDLRVRSTTTFRILKDRYTGRSAGTTFYLGYDHQTGMLFKTVAPEDNPFSDDEGDDDF
jgi:twinkle protein